MRYQVTVTLLLCVLMSSCKPKEVELYEQGVILYNQIGMQDAGISCLLQSGDLGCGKAFVFLAEKSIVEALRVKRTNVEEQWDVRIEHVKGAISCCLDALQYYSMAREKGCDVADSKMDEVRGLMKGLQYQVYIIRAEREMSFARSVVAQSHEQPDRKLNDMNTALKHYSDALDLYRRGGQEFECTDTQAIARVERSIADIGDRILETKREIERRNVERMAKERLNKIESAVAAADNLKSVVDGFLEDTEDAAKALGEGREIEGECIKILAMLNDAASYGDNRINECAGQVKAAIGMVRKRNSELTTRIEEERKLAIKKSEEARLAAEREAAEKKRAEELAAAEAQRKQSAEFCLREDVDLTVAAMTEIITSLSFKSDTGNKLIDKQNETRERGRFRGRIAHVTGIVVKVDSALLGGINIWIDADGIRIKCCFGGMSKNDALRFSQGEKISVAGTIDGTGLWAEDMVLANCRCR